MNNKVLEAVMQGDENAVNAAISNGAAVDERDNAGRTPLMAAVYKNMSFVAEALIDHGADINAADHEGHSVLYYAAAHGNFESVYMLYERNIKLDQNDLGFVNALEAARENGYANVVELLVAAEKQQNG